MYLKALELDGFKSFSNKTILDFTRGITAVVGPNGSGKSNILDAILWVLGEQSYKSIRAAQSSDVIFSGGKNKRASNFAEVSLIIENSDRYLDYESDEVKITRKVYRNGEGEYLINNKRARLKDIHNLFMDTGIGKQAYSIIGQGRVERIIGSNPKEIREIIEEAAGTKKAKIEKEDALKRLENVAGELEKISFIEKDLDNRVKRLKNESEKASLYKTIIEDIEVLKYMLDEFNLVKFENLDKELKNRKKEIESKIKEIELKLEQENTELSSLITERNTNQEKLNEYKSKTNLIYEELEKNKNKLNNIKQEKSNFEVKLNEKILLKDKLIIDLNNQKDKLESIEIQEKDTFIEFDKKAKLKEKLENEIEDINNKLEIINKQVEEKDDELRNIEVEIYKLKISNEELERKIKLSENNLQTLQNEKNENDIKLNGLNLELDSLNFKKDEFSKVGEEVKNKEDKINLDIQELEYEKNNISKNINSYTHKIQILKSEIISMQKTIEENYFTSTSTKYILNKYKNDGNVIDSVSNLLKLDEKYLTAISGLAGGLLNDIVINDSNKVNIYISDLKKEKIGTVSFLPLNIIKNYERNVVLPKIDGVIDFAKNLVNINSKLNLNILITYIFGNSIVVDSIETANKVIKQGFNDKIITLDGDIFSSRGRVTGGFKKNKVDLTLLKKDELNNKEKELYSIEKLKSEADSQYEKITQNIYSLKEELSDVFKNENIGKLNEVKNSIEDVNYKISSITRAIKTIEYEIKETETSIVENKDKIDLNKENIKKNSERLDEIFDIKQDLEIELGNIGNINKLTKKLNTINVEYAVLNEKYTNILNNKKDIKNQYDILSKDIDDIFAFENDKDKLFEKFDLNLREYEELVKNIEKEKNSNNENIKKFEDLLKLIDEKEHNLIKVRNELEKELIKESNLSEKLAENIIRNSNDLENTLENMRIEEERVDNIKNSDKYFNIGEEDINGIKRDISSLEYKKNNIGLVNLSSIEEYNIEFEKHSILLEQMQDLEKSSRSIRELISKIDDEMKTKFSYALTEIRNNFKYMCSEIFYGARGDIKLTNPDDILSSGLELSVKYKNKPEQTLLLLSGGEKSMLAVSFIMAIFMFKPSPFTFFDEIEAALDERNTKKIVELLRRFIEKSQFILITHNKETMKGADRLYGVSMNKEVGESKIVSVDI